MVELMAYTTWEIWKARCKACMEGNNFLEMEVVSNARMQWQDFKVEMDKRTTIETIKKLVREDKWKKPPNNTHKLDCDVVVL